MSALNLIHQSVFFVQLGSKRPDGDKTLAYPLSFTYFHKIAQKKKMGNIGEYLVLLLSLQRHLWYKKTHSSEYCSLQKSVNLSLDQLLGQTLA